MTFTRFSSAAYTYESIIQLSIFRTKYLPNLLKESFKKTGIESILYSLNEHRENRKVSFSISAI